MKIGIISDTHDFFDPKIPELFAEVDYILHAGDIGKPWILFQLEQIAPVTAVAGNTDDPSFNFSETEIVTLAARKFLVHHIIDPRGLHDRIKDRVAREKPHAIIFGHTHKPFHETIGGTIYFNPGYAGKHRFGLARSAAILHCDDKQVRPEFLPL